MTDDTKSAAALLGSLGGAAKSKRKTRAARKNGKRGGRAPKLYKILRRYDDGNWEAVYSTGRGLGVFADRQDALACCRQHRDHLKAAALAAAARLAVPAPADVDESKGA